MPAQVVIVYAYSTPTKGTNLMTRRTLSITAALFMIVALLLSGCAAPAAPVAPAAPADTAAAPANASAATTDTAAAATPAGDLPVVRVGTNAEYQPMEFVDEKGNITGFDYDIVNAIAKQAGFKAEWTNAKWDGIFVALANGEFDIVASSVTITDERKKTIDFSDPYFNAGQVIAVKADNTTITGPDSLTAGVKVGVQLGTTGDIWLTDNTKADVKRFDENPLAMQALSSGDVDAVVGDSVTIADIVTKNPELKIKIVGEPFTDELYGIAIRQGQPELVAKINKALADIKADGTYDTIYAKYFGPATK